MIEKEQDLLKLTKHELLKIATDLDVKYRTRMAKPELVDSIVEVVQEKRKEVDPKTEKLLVDQTMSLISEHADLSVTKEEMEASKYQRSLKDEKAEEDEVEEPKEVEAKIEVKKIIEIKPSNVLGGHVLEDYNHLPQGYNDNSITLMVIDPTNIYSYWEVTDWRREEILSSSNNKGAKYETVVKLHDVTDVNFNGSNAWSSKEFNVGIAPNWYFSVDPNRSYCTEIGLKLENNKFLLIARSNVISTPRDTVSDFYDEEWMMIDFNKKPDIYNEMYRLSGGHVIKRYQLNSAFITELGVRDVNISIPTQSLNSESISSQMLEYKKVSEQDFWMWVDTELIVYGQVKPDASSLTVNGEKIKFDKDGRFRLQMALPNGKYPFRVQGVSSDGSMSKEITPVVTRKIEK